MREQLEQRLGELRAQYEHGLKVMSELETQQATLRRTLLRISGAVEVLEEELNRSPQPAAACDDAHTRADAHTGCNEQAALNGLGAHDEPAAHDEHAAAHDAAHALELTEA
jgi:hypothetical protein